MTNQYEAIELLEAFLDKAHTTVYGMADSLFVAADKFVDHLKANLPETEEVDLNNVPEPEVAEEVKEPSVAEMLNAVREAAHRKYGKPTAWDTYRPQGPFGEAFIKSLYQQVLEGKLFRGDGR